MLLSEHYKLTIGDDKFVDYFTFNEKRRKRFLYVLSCNVGYWWVDKCVVGVIHVLKIMVGLGGNGIYPIQKENRYTM